MTSLGMTVVPVAVLIDEYGIVQSTRPRLEEIENLVAEKREPPVESPPVLADDWTDANSIKANFDWSAATPQQAIWYGDTCLKSNQLADAMKAYEYALQKAETSDDPEIRTLVPEVNFRLGVVMRARYDDKKLGSPADFGLASKYWTEALAGNPNQYIWRRRIEQYGPRLIKPYPFYDWIQEAFNEIRARGDDPVSLTVSLAGAEIALPTKQKIKPKQNSENENPDPEAKITLVDHQNSLVEYVATVVPSGIKPGGTVRVHLQFFPANNGKWNNESSPMQVWVDESKTGTVSRHSLGFPNAADATSSEYRTVEFEFQSNEDASSANVSGFALFNVCSADDSQCLFRRLNFQIEIPLK